MSSTSPSPAAACTPSHLASALPPITESALIDGTSQPGYAGEPLIVIDASSSGMADGLTIAGPDVMVRGLVSDGFVLGAGTFRVP